MPNDQGQIVIRKATEAYVGQIAEILVEDWKRAYRGIMDSAFLDAMIVWCLKENQEARIHAFPFTVANPSESPGNTTSFFVPLPKET